MEVLIQSGKYLVLKKSFSLALHSSDVLILIDVVLSLKVKNSGARQGNLSMFAE